MSDLAINWKKVIDTLHQGVFVIDTGGLIRYVNPALERLTGYRSDELIGKSCIMLECSGCEPWEDRGSFRCMLFTLGRSMNPVACRINNKLGHGLNVVKQASILRDANGVPVGAVETIRDMEKLKGSPFMEFRTEILTDIFETI